MTVIQKIITILTRMEYEGRYFHIDFLAYIDEREGEDDVQYAVCGIDVGVGDVLINNSFNGIVERIHLFNLDKEVLDDLLDHLERNDYNHFSVKEYAEINNWKPVQKMYLSKDILSKYGDSDEIDYYTNGMSLIVNVTDDLLPYTLI